MMIVELKNLLIKSLYIDMRAHKTLILIKKNIDIDKKTLLNY